MTDKDFILAPKTIATTVKIEPVNAILNSLLMLNSASEYQGMDDWIYEANRTLNRDILNRNELLIDGFYAVFEFDEAARFDDFRSYVDYLESLDTYALRNRMVDSITHPHEKYGADRVIEPPTAEALLSDVDVYLGYVRRLMDTKGKEEYFRESFLRQVHSYLTRPADLQRDIVNHLREIWDLVYAKEWRRVLPVMQETVEAFSQMNFSDMSSLEVTRAITGRDMSSSWVGDMLENDSNTQLIFLVLPHIGPYVTAHRTGDNVLRIGFGPRLPEGVRAKSPALDRSELLVRLNALADDTRLRILALFRDDDELCAQDIIQILDLSQSAASRHLRQLTATRYLSERRLEGAKCYSLNIERMDDTLEALQRFVTGR